MYDPQSGANYFVNLKTNESKWELPELEEHHQESSDYSDADDNDEDMMEMDIPSNDDIFNTTASTPEVETEHRSNIISIRIEASDPEIIHETKEEDHQSYLSPVMSSISLNSSKSLELSSQRDLLMPLELHTLDTVWHHLIPFVYRWFFLLICDKKKMDKTKIDKLIKFIYSKCHLSFLTLSALLYIFWILSGAYNYNHILTSMVYWWFIIESILLLYTANFRMFKEFLCSFMFWFKVISITIGVISRN